MFYSQIKCVYATRPTVANAAEQLAVWHKQLASCFSVMLESVLSSLSIFLSIIKIQAKLSVTLLNMCFIGSW